jgi:signal transduction histidine kinase
MLAEAYNLTKISMATTRTLVSELSPPALHRGKLAEALVWLAKHMNGRYNLTITLAGTGACPELPEALYVLLFQCAQELLFNVVRHAQAGHASITLQAAADSLRLEVRDDGQGFPSRRPDTGERQNGGFGLQSVQRRLEVFGGAMRIASLPEKGTRVTIEVPLT